MPVSAAVSFIKTCGDGGHCCVGIAGFESKDPQSRLVAIHVLLRRPGGDSVHEVGCAGSLWLCKTMIVGRTASDKVALSPG